MGHQRWRRILCCHANVARFATPVNDGGKRAQLNSSRRIAIVACRLSSGDAATCSFGSQLSFDLRVQRANTHNSVRRHALYRPAEHPRCCLGLVYGPSQFLAAELAAKDPIGELPRSVGILRRWLQLTDPLSTRVADKGLEARQAFCCATATGRIILCGCLGRELGGRYRLRRRCVRGLGHAWRCVGYNLRRPLVLERQMEIVGGG